MLYVISVNIYRVDHLIFTAQCELSKLQINPDKIFYFSVKNSRNMFVSWKTDGLERFTAGFSSINRYKFKLVWIVQTGQVLPIYRR
jgi:hypothetical protein